MEQARKIQLTVSSIRSLTPDVAVINTVATTGGTDSQGQALAPTSDRGTWIVVQRNNLWLMAALRVYSAKRASPP
jgi:hypothetical protein